MNMRDELWNCHIARYFHPNIGNITIFCFHYTNNFDVYTLNNKETNVLIRTTVKLRYIFCQYFVYICTCILYYLDNCQTESYLY
jgi:hypothetical protein